MSIGFEKKQFEVKDKHVEVYISPEQNKPVIYLNTFDGGGKDIYQGIKKTTDWEFSFVKIDNLNWNMDMSPWAIPAISENDTSCTGGADDYLCILIGEIVPAVEQWLHGVPQWRAIAGYSLAGLFAIYSLYRANIFSRAASMSGSLWFPNFLEYVYSHDFMCIPECVYFSLGDRESRTNNSFFKAVQDNTEQIKDYYAGKGIVTELVMNKGDHHKNVGRRMEKGIQWLLEQ